LYLVRVLIGVDQIIVLIVVQMVECIWKSVGQMVCLSRRKIGIKFDKFIFIVLATPLTLGS
jgi:hypothetical protein